MPTKLEDNTPKDSTNDSKIEPKTESESELLEKTSDYVQKHIENSTLHNEESESASVNKPARKNRCTYTQRDRERVVELFTKRGLSAKEAAIRLNVGPRSAQNWCKEVRAEKNSKGPTKSSKFKKKHRDYVVQIIDEKPSLKLSEALSSLTTQFSRLKITEDELLDFVNSNYKISLTRELSCLISESGPKDLEKLGAWVNKQRQTDMRLSSNCVFVDEITFQINTNVEIAHPQTDSSTEASTSQNQLQDVKIYGAISSKGMVNAKTRQSLNTGKKKNNPKNSAQTQKKADVGYFTNFLHSTMDVLDRHEQFKGCYIVINSMCSCKMTSIEKDISGRGYRCVYLPLYCSDLSPMELFWRTFQSNFKREELESEETLDSRIRDAFHDICLNSFESFFAYSEEKFKNCFDQTHQ